MIRPVGKGDQAEWLRMRRLLWPETSVAEHEDEMNGYFIRGENLFTCVAEKAEKKLIGFLEANIRIYAEDCDSINVGYIEGWFVDADFRRTGAGGMMVRHAEQWALSRGCKEIASDCELTNEVSLKAHLCLGYQDTSRLIHFKKRL